MPNPNEKKKKSFLLTLVHVNPKDQIKTREAKTDFDNKKIHHQRKKFIAPKSNKISIKTRKTSMPLNKTQKREVMFDRDGTESILIGPQNASEVKLPTSSPWMPGTSTTNEALTNIKENIKTTLEDVANYNDISDSAKISALRERVNDLQDLLKNLYNSFAS